jgi:flagella basal body P-ring formation protein FlgA
MPGVAFVRSLVSSVGVTIRAKVRRGRTVRIVALPAVLIIHLGSRVVAVVATDTISVLAANR